MARIWKYAVGAAFILSVVLVIIPKVYPICEMMLETAKGGTTPMRCFYAYQAELPISISAVVVSFTLFFLKGVEGRRLGGLFLALLGIIAVTLVQPFIIGVCTGHAAPCHTTRIWTTSIGSLLVLTGGIIAWIAPLSVRGEGSMYLEREKL